LYFVKVYDARGKMGEKLDHKINRLFPDHDIDSVIPIPETSRTAAMQCAQILNRPYREGFVKNRYIARTFIMPGQETRRKTVRLKLNTIHSEFKGKVVLLIDDSIVRGTTSIELIQMARDAGAKKVYFASAAPPVRYPNVYGIDIPTRYELVAHNRTEEEIETVLGAERVIYNDLEDVIDAVRSLSSEVLKDFDASCFDGRYITPEITEEFLLELEQTRGVGRKLHTTSPSESNLFSATTLRLNNSNITANNASMAILETDVPSMVNFDDTVNTPRREHQISCNNNEETELSSHFPCDSGRVNGIACEPIHNQV
jgi:amidophosphoribosyltransferase